LRYIVRYNRTFLEMNNMSVHKENSSAGANGAGKIMVLLVAVVLAGGAGYWLGARTQTAVTPVSVLAAPVAETTNKPAEQLPTTSDVPSPHVVPAANSTDKPADTSGNLAVAVVNDQTITLRAIEDALLKKEGVAQLLDMLDKQYAATDWTTLRDHDIIVQTATWRLTRLSMAAQLLKLHASDAREDLIGITLVQQALAKNNVVIDEAAIQNEVKRMEKRHYEALEARKQPYMEFKQFIEQTQKVPFENYIHQEGFKMGVGIRILVERAAHNELTDDELKKYLEQHDTKYRVQEAADVSAIYIPYQTTKQDGKDIISEDEKIRVFGVMQQLHDAIIKRQVSFERSFQAFGKVYDSHADAQGRLGWVNRDGTRTQKGARRVDAKAMAETFAVQPPYPVLLKPVVGDSGVELLLVHSRRAGKAPVFAELRERLINDIVDSDLPARTKKMLDGLRRNSVIDYRSLPPLIEQRAKAAGISGVTPPSAPQQ
jgi:hypothetical protein